MAYDTYNTLIVNMLVWRISLWNCFRCRKSEYSLGAVVGNCGKLLDDVSWGV